MEHLDPALQVIARGSLFLHERIGEEISDGDATPTLDMALRDKRLDRWQELLGGPAALRDRIAAAGWPRRAIDAALAGGRQGAMGAVRAGGRIPSWLSLLGRVISAAPNVEGVWIPTIPFGELITPFVVVGRQILHTRASGRIAALGGEAMKSLELALAGSVSDILAPCFLAEFSAGRPIAPALLGIFAGDTASPACGRYRDFVDHHSADGLRGLLAQFSAGARLAATRVEKWVDAWTEFFERLHEDLPAISGRLLREINREIPTVIAIEPHLSDPHNHGRSVAIITFSNGRKVVYKPRSLAPEAVWRAFVREVGPSFEPLSAEVIDRGTHGWMEYVAPEGAADDRAVRRFYRSAGALLCLARAFAVTDLHFENIVATGDRALPLDLETIAQPQPRSSSSTALDKIAAEREAALRHSVRATEALPARYSFSDRAPIDISAFADLRSSTQLRPVWRAIGTDAIVRMFEEQPIAAANLPRSTGQVFPPDDFGEDIIAGFEGAWQSLATASPRLTGPEGLLDRIADVPVRFVFRATEIYYRIFARACAPEKLHDGIDFSIEIEALYRVLHDPGLPNGFRRIIDAEAAAMRRGDIPRFTTRPATTAVFEEGALLMDAAFAASGLDTVRGRLATLDPGQRATERCFIEASFAASRYRRKGDPAETIDYGHPPLSAEEALDAAVQIGRSIVEAARPRPDGGLSWIGITHRQEAGGPAAVVLDESLYEGTTGIGLFLGALYRATGAKCWAESAEGALVDALRLARETPAGERQETIRRLGLGLSGFGGLVYGLALSGDLLGSAPVQEEAGRLASWIDAALNPGPGLDLLDGIVGAIPGLLAVATRQGRQDAELTALACGRAAAAKGPDAAASGERQNSLQGYGHGPAGVAATLALFAERDGSLRRAVEDAIEPGNSYLHDGGDAQGPVGWCKGPIGQTLAVLVARRRLGTPHSEDVGAVERAVERSLASRLALDQVCCGLFGAAEALLTAAEPARRDLAERARRLSRALLARARRRGGFRLLAGVPTSFQSPGLFQGTSGIGYTLLRVARPDLFPSVLLTEWRR